MPPSRFTAHDLETMLRLYEEGSTYRAIAERFGVSTSHVSKQLARHGSRSPTRDPATKDATTKAGQIRAYLAEHPTTSNEGVARRLGVPLSTVVSALRIEE